jgi:MFS family permease
VITDRYRRLPVLVGTDLARGLVLCAIPGLYALGWLDVTTLIVAVIIFGTLSLFFDSADQSFLPRVVPGQLLTPAFAKVEQSEAVAQTTGPALAGVLVPAIGAPLVILVDAVSYLLSGLLLMGVKVDESRTRPAQRNLRAELKEGVAWVYRHPTLSAMAWSGHIWFVFQGVLGTTFSVFVLGQVAAGGLDLGSLRFGLAYACAGVGAVVGTAVAPRFGLRFGVGPATVWSHLAMPVGWIPIALARPGPLATVLCCAGQFLFWLALSASSSNELGYRNAITPDRLQGRMNTTMRSINRAALVAGAPLGGWLAQSLGFRPALWIGILGFLAAGLVLALSPMRRAAMPATT